MLAMSYEHFLFGKTVLICLKLFGGPYKFYYVYTINCDMVDSALNHKPWRCKFSDSPRMNIFTS